tara:strand:+ start:8258 stop:8506 length:249 start_codon:yes stop_codon:yes gene_type:complete
MKKKLSIKQRIKYMFTSNFGRLAIAGAFLFIGGILGTDGLLEIESQKTFWDCIMYIGTFTLLSYCLYGIYWAIRNTIKDIKD